ncbi:hypothetical protein Asp14428_46170 [Actinoplanes sp. NBRC 14428]|nr:hypothetical protein Asp14428_46170 [Actinoplanes sp. NBRC 14428]
MAAFDRVEVGQVEQDQPAQGGLVLAVERALPDEALAWQHTDPVEQAVGGLERPHTQAWATPVVGRRTPTGDSFSRASALNRLDLPLPVLPARATTV